MVITPDPHKPQTDTPLELPDENPKREELPPYREEPVHSNPDEPADPNADPQQEEDAGSPSDPDYVRPAGRKEMDLPPDRWDIVDETLDESFPASDPPGGY